MAGICTARSVCAGGNHNTLTVTLDGEAIVIQLVEGEAATPLSADEKELLVRLTARRLRNSGVTLANFLNRAVCGDEATNVQIHQLLGPGAAVTKTNIGTSYVNVLPGANGERKAIDFTGRTEFLAKLTANLVGTGPFKVRIVRDSDSLVLFENANVALTGEQELLSNAGAFASLPASFQNAGIVYVRMQAASTVGADDPVFRSVELAVR